MEIDSLKTQLGNLLALHRDDDANEDDIVFATVDFIKKAHNVAQMLLLEGRFQELQRCLHLCQAAFGDTSNVRASVVGLPGSQGPLFSFVGPSAAAQGDRKISADIAGDDAPPMPYFVSPANASSTTTTAELEFMHEAQQQQQQQQSLKMWPYFMLHSEEDQRVFTALQSRTAQLQKQLEAAMRTRRGRDTEYYMERLGLREKGAAPLEVKQEAIKIHVHQLPASRQNPYADINSSATAGGGASTALTKGRGSLMPVTPPRVNRGSLHTTAVPSSAQQQQQPTTTTTTAAAARSPALLPFMQQRSTTTATAVPGPSSSAGTAIVSVSTPPPPLFPSDGAGVVAPPPPERGVSFGNQMHFSRGKAQVELPPLVTSGRLFGVSHDNPTSIQHTVFGSSSSPASAAAVTSASAGRAPRLVNAHAPGTAHYEDSDSDFGVRAVEAVFGVEGGENATPLHLQPVPDNVRLWSSSSDDEDDGVNRHGSEGDRSTSSNAYNSTSTSMQVEKADSPPPLPPVETAVIMDDAPLVSDVHPTAEEDDESIDDDNNFRSPRRHSSLTGASAHGAPGNNGGGGGGTYPALPGALRSAMKSSMLSSTFHSVNSLMRRSTAAGSGNDAALINFGFQRRRTGPDAGVPGVVVAAGAASSVAGGSATSGRPAPPPTWLPLTHSRKRSTDSYTMSATSNATFTASTSRTVASMAESYSTGTTTFTTTSTGTSASDAQSWAAAANAGASPAAMEAARAVEAARLTTQYVSSSLKAQHSRSEQAMRRCDALVLSRLPYNARQAYLAAQERVDADDDDNTKEGGLTGEHSQRPPAPPQQPYSSQMASPYPGSVLTLNSAAPFNQPSIVSNDWTPLSQLLASPAQSQALSSSSPGSPGPGAAHLASPLQPVISATSYQHPSRPTQLHTLSPAAEQQLREIRAAYELERTKVSQDVRGLEARWVGQHRQLQTQASLPPLENIAEWRKRRGRWQQQQQQQAASSEAAAGGKDGRHRGGGGGGSRRHSHPRRRTRVTQPPVVAPSDGDTPHSSGSGGNLPPNGIAAPPTSSSRSPSLMSATPSRGSRLGSDNVDGGGGGSGPSVRSSAEAAARLPLPPSAASANNSNHSGSSSGNSGVGGGTAGAAGGAAVAAAAAMAGYTFLVTPVDTHALPLRGAPAGGVLNAAFHPSSREGRKDSHLIPPAVPAAPLRLQAHSAGGGGGEGAAVSSHGERQTSADGLSGPLALLSKDVENSIELADVAAEQRRELPAILTTNDRSSLSTNKIRNDGATAAREANNAETNAFARDTAAGPEAADTSGTTATATEERSEGEGEEGAERRSSATTSAASLSTSASCSSSSAAAAAAAATYTYHPGVDAILRERQQKRAAQDAGATAMFVRHSVTAQDTLATWRHTLDTMEEEDEKAAHLLLTAERASVFRNERRHSSLNTLVYPSDEPFSASYSLRPSPAVATVQPQQAPPGSRSDLLHAYSQPVELAPVHRHGIRCGAASRRAQRTQEVLSSAIREASQRVRDEDIFHPAWRPAEASSAAVASAPPTTRSSGPPVPRIDFPNVFVPGDGQAAVPRVSTTMSTTSGFTFGGSAELRRLSQRISRHRRSTLRAAGDNRSADMSLTSVADALSNAHTPAVLSLTAKALTPQFSRDGSPFVSPGSAQQLSLHQDKRVSLLASLDTAPLRSSAGSTIGPLQDGADTSTLAAMQNAFQHLQAAQRIGDRLRFAQDWTRVPASLLGRCLPLCLGAVRLQRWWRQLLAGRAVRRRRMRVQAHLAAQQRRDAAALTIQRQVRVHWACQRVGVRRAAYARAIEQRVAAEGPMSHIAGATLMRANTNSSGGGSATGYATGLSDASGAAAVAVFGGASTTSSRVSHGPHHRRHSVVTGSDDRSRRGSVGEAAPGVVYVQGNNVSSNSMSTTATTTATMRKSSPRSTGVHTELSPLGTPVFPSASSRRSGNGGGNGSNNVGGGGGAESSSESSVLVDGNVRDPWAELNHSSQPRLLRSGGGLHPHHVHRYHQHHSSHHASPPVPPSPQQHQQQQQQQQRPFSSSLSAPFNLYDFAHARQSGAVTAVEVPQAVGEAEASQSRPLSLSSTNMDDENNNASVTTPAAAAAAVPVPASSSSTARSITSSTVNAQDVLSVSPSPLQEDKTPEEAGNDGTCATEEEVADSESAARRIQRWYRRCSAEETERLCHEVAVLSAVVTRRAPLESVREALRFSSAPHEDGSCSDLLDRDTDHNSDADPLTGTENDLDRLLSTETLEMRALLARCSGDVVQSYLRRAAAARQHGDYKTPLERVSLQKLQRARREREDEAKQQRLLYERQQRARQEQQQRRERQMVDAAKLLQRVGRGWRWRRWLRDRQLKDEHYRATHTLDLLSQTDTLGAHVAEYMRATAEQEQRGLTWEEEECVRLSGGPTVTAHVMARLRSTHPEWFGLNVDRTTAAYITQHGTAEQQQAVRTAQAFVAAFASRALTFGQYQHACARSIQLAWRLHRQRRLSRKLRSTL